MESSCVENDTAGLVGNWQDHPDIKFVMGLKICEVCEGGECSPELRTQIQLIQNFVRTWDNLATRGSDKLQRDDWRRAGQRAISLAASIRQTIEPPRRGDSWWDWLWKKIR